MAYSKKTWVDRTTEYPNRRTLTPTGSNNEYDVSRAEGLILNEGDAFNAATMNDLENRVDEGIKNAPFATTAQGEKADNAMPKNGGSFTGVVAAKMPDGTNYQRLVNSVVCTAGGTWVSGTHHILFVRK